MKTTHTDLGEEQLDLADKYLAMFKMLLALEHKLIKPIINF
jgi:hypothetical protein